MTERWKPDEYEAGFADVVGIYNVFLPFLLEWTEIKGTNCLEIGCGSGKWSAMFACLGFRCALVDIVPEMFDRVRLNFPIISKTFFFIHDDALVMKNTPIDIFDLVFSEGLYEHFLDIQDRYKFIINTYNCLRKDGIAIIMVPYKTGEDDEYQFEPEEMVSEWMQIFEKVKGFKFEKEGKIAFIGVIAKRIK